MTAIAGRDAEVVQNTVASAKGPESSRTKLAPSFDNAIALKESANKLYSDNKLTEALEEYENAIEMIANCKASNRNASELVSKLSELEYQVFYNKATVYWKIFKSMSEAEPEAQAALRSCELYCRKSLEINSSTL